MTVRDEDRPAPPEDELARSAEDADGEVDQEGEEEEEQGIEPSLGADDRRRDVAVALGAMVALACAIGLAFDPERAFTRVGFIAQATALVVLAVLAVARTRARGHMETLRPRGGDLTLAALVAGMIYVLALGGQPIAFPRGTAAEASFLAAYLPLIDPLHPDARHGIAFGCALLCALEELVLRALVQPALERATGVLGGWVATAVLDAAAWVPAALLLADSRIGFNPVLVGFAAVAAIATGWLQVRTGRVAPAALARALAAWALIEFPIWHP